MTDPDPTTVALWTALNRAASRLQHHIEAALKAAELPPLAWYDALLEIEKTAPDGIRPVDLQDRLLLPQYGLSRLLDRLVRADLVTRTPCPDDKRGQVLHISDKGRKTRRAMWPIYAAVLRKDIGAALTPAEATRFAAHLDRLGAERPDATDTSQP